MQLRWVFTVETAVILLKNIFEFTFNNKISTVVPVCSTWPSGKPLARCVGGLEFDSGPNLFLSACFFFRLSFSFSFPLVYILGITVLLCF